MALHPSVAAVRSVVRRCLADLDAGATVLVACSGGADSLALLSAAVFEGQKEGLRVVGVTVDHQLQDGSAERAQHVADQMRALGADDTLVATVTVSATGLGPEAAAREARYQVLEQLAERYAAERVLLGHTLDDQAETVLMGLTRGAGLRSLAGMRRGFDRFARPLLDVTRADTETACLAGGIEWWSDPHNEDPRFTRSRIRHRVLPVLEAELGPGVGAALARTAEMVRSDVEALDRIAQQWYDEHRLGAGTGSAAGSGSAGGGVAVEVAALAALDEAIRLRVLRLAALDAGCPPGELFRVHVLGIDELVMAYRGQTRVELPGHVQATRSGNLLRLLRL